jgi:hypothetical protein
MEIHEMVDGIQSKADLVAFVHALTRDLQSRRADWENDTLERYLSALARWLEDSDGYYRNQGREIPVTPTWRNFADMLIAAKMYE